MKRFKYLLITIVILLTLASAILKTSEKTKSIILQSTGSNVTSVSLKQSADILSGRLRLYGLNSFYVNVLEDEGQIRLQLPDNIELSEIEGLLTSRGQLSFYETYAHQEITDLLTPGDQLFKLLNNDKGNSPSDPRVGCASTGIHIKVDEYLQSLRLINSCKLMWGVQSEESECCLFALKANEKGEPLLVRSDIETIKSSLSNDSQNILIQIKLKPAATSIFAEATRNNLNRAIAIVVDDQVFYWPVVRVVIEGGEIEVSGTLNDKQVNYFLALVNNELLPLSFKLLK